MTAAIIITDWKPLTRNTLRGFLTAHLPSGMMLFEVAVHTRDGVWWVSPASKPVVGKDGTVLRDEAGKARYTPIVAFETKGARDRFSDQVLAALRHAQPQLFAEEVAP